MTDLETRATALAKMFHESYERLAPSFAYETRKASAVPWDQVPEANRKLMIAVCMEVLAHQDARATETSAHCRSIANMARYAWKSPETVPIIFCMIYDHALNVLGESIENDPGMCSEYKHELAKRAPSAS